MGKINLLKKIAGYRGVKKRAGFTLVEVIVAMGILMVIIVALLSSYGFYYKYTREIRYRTIGENLAQLQLEDLRNIPFTSFEKILNSDDLPSAQDRYNPNYNCPNYPPAEIFIYSDINECYFYVRDEIGPISYGNTPDWEVYPFPDSVTPDSLGEPVEQYFYAELKKIQDNEIPEIAYIKLNEEDKPVLYCSGKRDAEFVVEGLTSVPSDIFLPASIKVEGTADGKHDLILEKWTFPLYEKVVVIKDSNPEIDPATDLEKKLYEIGVTIYWTVDGVEKSVTVKQEVSFEGQI
jgi:hypothetical protein